MQAAHTTPRGACVVAPARFPARQRAPKIYVGAVPLNSRPCSPVFRGPPWHKPSQRSRPLRASAGNAGEDQRPLLQQMLAVAPLCLCGPIIEPAMALIESLILGQFAPAADLASVAPCTGILSFFTYGFQSIQVTALARLGVDLANGDMDAAQTTFSTVVAAALACGAVIALGLNVAGKQVLSGMISSPEVVTLAMTYLGTRALAQPATLANMVCLAALLAERQTKPVLVCTVALLTLATALMYVTVGVAGLGVRGAGISTALSQWALLGMFVVAMRLYAKKEGGLSPTLRFATLERFRTLAGSLGFLSGGYILKNGTYLVIHAFASALPALHLAAHQAVFAAWNFCAFCNGPVEQMALAFWPRAAAHARATARAGEVGGDRELQDIAVITGVAAVLVSNALAAGIAVVMTSAPASLTSNAAMWPLIQSCALFAFGSLAFAGIELPATAAMLADGHGAQYMTMHALVLAGVIGTLAAGANLGWGLQGIWAAVMAFYFFRAVISIALLLGRRSPHWLLVLLERRGARRRLGSGGDAARL
ncbi:unnamed protein product [Pedinophyceae sp. YPF-701]|nr:unnamed protein product [Pedinophyceae sp. YPF-701]